jgi:HEPN domain-containing protein
MTEPLKDDIRQWLTVAEDDFRAYTVLAADDAPPAMAVCFHCQQYIEKLLKAILTTNGEEVPKTHDLRSLSLAVSRYFPDILTLVDDVAELTVYGVETRYPAAMEISETEMTQTVKIATETGTRLKKYLLGRLGK